MNRKRKLQGTIKAFVFAVLVFYLASCGFFRSPGKDRCDKKLSKEQMTDILTDIYMLEAYIREYQRTEPAAKDSAKYFFEVLFLRHGVEKSVFEKALDCYLLDREAMEIIHEDILTRLSLIESEAGTNPEAR